MDAGHTLLQDRARVVRLFELFENTDDQRARVRIMDEALAEVEFHKGNTADVAYILHGRTQGPFQRPKLLTQALLMHLSGIWSRRDNVAVSEPLATPALLSLGSRRAESEGA